MNVQFGRWHFDGAPIDRSYIEKVLAILAPYGPDGLGSYKKSNICILYRAFGTSKESLSEVQPLVTRSGCVITWDGRLDNRSELLHSFANSLTAESSDLSIVSAAYQAWNIHSLAQLVGDWALSVWDPHTQALVLAKDPLGKRHLYFSLEKSCITWSTLLDPLVLLGPKPFVLDEEYIAGWISFFPAAHLTPYVGIAAVAPSTAAVIRGGKQINIRYWEFNPGKKLRYATDEDYEERFREVFAHAVSRNLRSDRPVLAELSGGIDSSSIVCIADSLIKRGLADAPSLYTVSYYDDTEPNWNERPYFVRVEQKLGHAGRHIDVSSLDAFAFEPETAHFAATPGDAVQLNAAAREYHAYIDSLGIRVVLSGLGGDEVTGGVPVPTPELADLLATARWKTLAHQLKIWALTKKKPWFHLLLQALASFLPPALAPTERHRKPAPWLRRDFVWRNRPALLGYPSRTKLWGPLPSFQDNLTTINALRREIASIPLPAAPGFERRYPYLDRELLEFLFSLPPQQLLRPGQRRSLMRRALVDLVPPEILDRKRKAFVSRTLMISLSRRWQILHEKADRMECVSFGLIDPSVFKETLHRASRGKDVAQLPLLRVLVVEAWLQTSLAQGILRQPNVALEAGAREDSFRESFQLRNWDLFPRK